MSDEQDTYLGKTSEQVHKYLQSSYGEQQYQKTFDEIMIQFIVDAPIHARIFSMDNTARLAFSLLRQTARLFEQLFPEIDFKYYLSLCVNNDCHSLRIYNAYPDIDHAIFQLITDTICHALVIYVSDTPAELRPDYLSRAQFYFAELNMVNISQSNKAKKNRTDALSELIFAIAKNNSDISSKQLLKELPEYEIIDEIEDGYIYFKQNDGQDKALVSGLKDRLNRAKKKLSSSIN